MRRSLDAFLPLAWTLVLAVPVGFAVAALVEGHYAVPLTAGSFRFARGDAAPLLLGAALVLAGFYVHRWHRPRLKVSRGLDLAALKPGWRRWAVALPTGLRATAVLLLGLGLMGPQSIHARDRTEIEGIDIVLILDMSLSMQAADIRPNRFAATKAVVRDFIRRRPNDRIGAVVFGRDAYTLMPLTTDKESLQTLVGELELELIDGRGTAIGNAVGTGLNRLRGSEAESKVIILLTDGDSNAGNVSPDQAAELASTMDVKVYSVLMGQSGEALVRRGTGLFGGALMGRGNYPVNPELLERMATRTGGEHFTVADRDGLEQSFHRILDALEKSDIEDAGKVYGELYPAFLGPALLLLLLELLATGLLLRRWP
ncbi:MAG: VWA domain-containing protein [Myxococcota bacterium]